MCAHTGICENARRTEIDFAVRGMFRQRFPEGSRHQQTGGGGKIGDRGCRGNPITNEPLRILLVCCELDDAVIDALSIRLTIPPCTPAGNLNCANPMGLDNIVVGY